MTVVYGGDINRHKFEFDAAEHHTYDGESNPVIVFDEDRLWNYHDHIEFCDVEDHPELMALRSDTKGCIIMPRKYAAMLINALAIEMSGNKDDVIQFNDGDTVEITMNVMSHKEWEDRNLGE